MAPVKPPALSKISLKNQPAVGIDVGWLARGSAGCSTGAARCRPPGDRRPGTGGRSCGAAAETGANLHRRLGAGGQTGAAWESHRRKLLWSLAWLPQRSPRRCRGGENTEGSAIGGCSGEDGAARGTCGEGDFTSDPVISCDTGLQRRRAQRIPGMRFTGFVRKRLSAGAGGSPCA